MNTNITGRMHRGDHPVEGQCPTWCVDHARQDAGKPDEWIRHTGRVVEVGEHSLHIERSVPLNWGAPEDTIWLNGEQLTSQQAVELAAALIGRAGQVDNP